MIRALFLILLSTSALADVRYCGAPQRDADGTIHRDMSEVRKFRSEFPCPETGLKTGKCDGWAVDHVIPLACGGCDKTINMQWLKIDIKSCAGNDCKDRWERKVYCK